MKAVILAAGKSTRTYPLTVNKPKPLLPVANKSIMQHNLDALNGLVSEAIIVVNFKKEQIMEEFGLKYKNIRITYVIQKVPNGTGGAVLAAKDHLDGKFIVMGGDDIFSRKDIQKCIKHKYCILGQEVKEPQKFGILDIKKGCLVKIDEKPKKPKSNLANTAFYVVDKKVFDFKLKKTSRGEIEFTDAVTALAKKEKVKVEKVKDYWLPIGYPWDILEANAFLLDRIKKSVIKGKIERGVTVKGKLILGKGSLIMSGVYIEGNVIIGENCKIGPNSYIRGPTTIGSGSRVGAAEVKACVMFDNCHCDHPSYVGDSVLAEKAHLGALTSVANLRHNGKNHKSMVKGKLIDTGRRKLGVIMAENTDTGTNTSIYPGRKMWPGTFTAPGEIVKKDKMR